MADAKKAMTKEEEKKHTEAVLYGFDEGYQDAQKERLDQLGFGRRESLKFAPEKLSDMNLAKCIHSEARLAAQERKMIVAKHKQSLGAKLSLRESIGLRINQRRFNRMEKKHQKLMADSFEKSKQSLGDMALGKMEQAQYDGFMKYRDSILKAYSSMQNGYALKLARSNAYMRATLGIDDVKKAEARSTAKEPARKEVSKDAMDKAMGREAGAKQNQRAPLTADKQKTAQKTHKDKQISDDKTI